MIVKMVGTVQTVEYEIPLATDYKEILFIDLRKNIELLAKRFSHAHRTYGFALNDPEKFIIYTFGTPNGLWNKSKTVRNISLDDDAQYSGEIIVRGSVTDPIVINPNIVIGERFLKNVVFLFIDVFKYYNDVTWVTALLRNLGFAKTAPPKRRYVRKRDPSSAIPVAFTEVIDAYIDSAEKRKKNAEKSIHQQERVLAATREKIVDMIGERLLNEWDESNARLNQLRFQLKTAIKRCTDLESGGQTPFVDRELLREQGIRVSISSRKKEDMQGNTYRDGKVIAETGHLFARKSNSRYRGLCPKGTYLGKFKIHIPIPRRYKTDNGYKVSFDHNSIRIFNDLKHPTEFQHWHVRDRGQLCWGNTAAPVKRFLATGDCTAIILTLATMLSVGVSGSPFKKFVPPPPPKEAKNPKKKRGKKNV